MWTSVQGSGATVIRIIGEADLSDASALGAEIALAAASGPVVVDLSDSVFIDIPVAREITNMLRAVGAAGLVIPGYAMHPARRLLLDLFPEAVMGIPVAASVERMVALLKARGTREELNLRLTTALQNLWSNSFRLEGNLHRNRQLRMDTMRILAGRREAGV